MRNREMEIRIERKAKEIAERVVNAEPPISFDGIDASYLARAVLSLHQELADTARVRDELLADLVARRRDHQEGQ